jgi:hypothetical protein
MNNSNISLLRLLVFHASVAGIVHGSTVNSGTFPEFPLEYSVKALNAEKSVVLSFNIKNKSNQSVFIHEVSLPWVHSRYLGIALYSNNPRFEPRSPGWRTEFSAIEDKLLAIKELKPGDEIGGHYVVSDNFDKILDGRLAGDVGINWNLQLNCYNSLPKGRKERESARLNVGWVGGFLILPKWTGTVTTHNKTDSSKQKWPVMRKTSPMEQAAPQLGTPQFPQMPDGNR